MTYEMITNEDRQKFRLQLLEDLRALVQQAPQAKEWLRSSEVSPKPPTEKDAWHFPWHPAKPPDKKPATL